MRLIITSNIVFWAEGCVKQIANNNKLSTPYISVCHHLIEIYQNIKDKFAEFKG